MNQVIGLDVLGNVFAVILAEDGDFVPICFITGEGCYLDRF
ncbi:hypothetical protein RZ532_20350 [Nitratireductor aquimarinus]|nr:hypothetical protein [Nitratireductor aquimarinus]MDV2968353.1 hypothetical protein [Nitratireductor aquimarinus]